MHIAGPMPTLYELNIYTRPGVILFDDSIEKFYSDIKSDLNFPDDVLSEQWFVPCDTDIENLLVGINESEFTDQEFKEFCLNNSLNYDLKDKISACRFLADKYGQCIGWVFIPHSESGKKIYKEIYNWVVLNNLVIQNEDSSTCIITGNASHLEHW
jgi:hypothetical protein